VIQIGRSLVRSQLVSVDFSLTYNSSDRTMARGSTQPLTEMSTRRIPWGKGGRCVRLTTYHHPVPLSRNLGTLTSWNPLGLSRPVMGLLYLHHSFCCSLCCSFDSAVQGGRNPHPLPRGCAPVPLPANFK